MYSLYKNKEVFLRELVSNAADALNKMQFEILTVPDLEDKDQELKITIAVDKKHNKLVIEDNGIGMTQRGTGQQHRHHRPFGHPGLPEEDAARARPRARWT